MKIQRRLLACLLAVVIGLMAMPLTALSEGEDDLPTGVEPELSTSQEIFDDLNKAPDDYVENGPNPNGLPFDSDVMAMTQNELLITTNSVYNKCIANLHTSYDSIADLDAGNIKDELYVTSNATHLNYATGVAFDPTHSGQKDHIFYMMNPQAFKGAIGAQAIEVYNLKTKQFTTKYYEADTFFGSGYTYKDLPYLYNAEAASFDGVYDDTVVFARQYKDTYSKPTYYNKLYFVQYQNNKIVEKRVLNLNNYMDNLSGYDSTSTKVSPQARPAFSVQCGDFDRDGKDEVAIISTPVGKHATVDASGKSKIENYTTEISIIDDPLGEAKRVYHETVYDSVPGSSTSPMTVMYAARGATGDIDGNSAEDLVLAGYTGSVTATTSGEFKNAFIPDKTHIGLTMICYNGENYVRTAIQSFEMSRFIKDGFYYDDPVWNTLAVETAAMNGFNAPATVFVSGTLYQFYDGGFNEAYTYARFKEARDSFASNTYVSQVVKGNLNNDELGRESLAFVIASKTSGRDELSVQIGDIYSDFTSTTQVFKDNSAAIKGKFNISKDKDLYMGQSLFALTAADYDVDGMKCRYVGTEYMYADPEVKAVLEAAPYFKELGDWVDFVGQTTYTITTSYAESTTGNKGYSTDTGYVVTEEGGFFVDINQQISIGSTTSSTSTWGDTYTTSYTTQFIAGPEDTVVIRRIPIELFAYQIWDNDTNDWRKNPDGSIYYATTLFRLKPTFYQLSLDEYNRFVKQYNEAIKDDPEAVLLYPIRTDATQDKKTYVAALPFNSTGNPYSYYTTVPRGGEVIGDTAIALGYSGGFTSSSKDYRHDHSEGETWSLGIHFNYQIQVGFGFKFFNAGGSIKAGGYFDYNYSWGGGEETIESSGYGGTGMVANINRQNYLAEDYPYCKRYGFRWNFATWPVVLSANNVQIPVYGYILYSLQYPGQSPQNVRARLEADYKTVTVTWDAPIDVGNASQNRVGYSIYRKISDSSVREKVGTVDADTFTFQDNYTSLERAKNYTYYVGADYDDNGQYSAITFTGSDIVGGLKAVAKPSMNAAPPTTTTTTTDVDRPIVTEPEATETTKAADAEKEESPDTGDSLPLGAVLAMTAAGLLVLWMCGKPKKQAG